MHPRNTFKDVNFGELAEKCPFLKPFLIQCPNTLKFSLDFANDDAIRALNQALLLEYYDINVEIPKDCLIPRVPLRLNYILWIEDLLQHFNEIFSQSHNITGLDIGTGPCAIYALLGARKNKWIMHGTDINQDSIEYAASTVEKNKLQDNVKLHHVTLGSYFSGILDDDNSGSFDFSMCNPPFFSDTKDSLVSVNYPPIPWSSKSQISQEIVCEGGEVNFVDKMIQESYKHPNLVKIYTTMIGVKKHLDPLVKRLQDYKCNNFITCVFHQGKISRWGLAWSWIEAIDLKSVPVPSKSNVNAQKSKTFEAIFQNVKSFSSFFLQITNVLKTLEMVVEQDDKDMYHNKSTIFVKAKSNTWSHSRRKRRMEKQNCKISLVSPSEEEHASKLPRLEEANSASSENNGHTSERNEETVTEKEDLSKQMIQAETASGIESKQVGPTEESTKKSNGVEEYGLNFTVCAVRQGIDVLLRLEYVSGSFGKDGVHQILQYLKNQSNTLTTM